MILPSEAYRIHILGGVVGRIGIEEGIGAVVVLDEGFKVLIFDNYICHAIFEFSDESEQPADVAGL